VSLIVKDLSVDNRGIGDKEYFSEENGELRIEN
jgi:hypothetical protein